MGALNLVGSGSSSDAWAAAKKASSQGSQALQSASVAAGNVGAQAAKVSGAGQALQNYGGQQWGLYQDSYTPVLQNLAKSAEINPQEYVNQAANTTGQAFDRQRGILERQLAGYGINANSGRFAGTLANLGRNEAAARAGAMNDARVTALQNNFSRLLSASGIGLNLGQQAMSGQSQAANAYGSAGGLYGQQAQLQRGIASQYEDLGNAAGAYGAYVDNSQPRQSAIGDLGNGTSWVPWEGGGGGQLGYDPYSSPQGSDNTADYQAGTGTLPNESDMADYADWYFGN